MFRTLLSGVLAVCVAVIAPAFAQAPQHASDLKFDQPAVTLISTGSGPKRPLRYKVTSGGKQRIDMAMQMSMAMAISLPDMEDVGEQKVDVPPFTMALDMDVTNVAANGDITYAVTVVDASMDGPGLRPARSTPSTG